MDYDINAEHGRIILNDSFLVGKYIWSEGAMFAYAQDTGDVNPFFNQDLVDWGIGYTINEELSQLIWQTVLNYYTSPALPFTQ